MIRFIIPGKAVGMALKIGRRGGHFYSKKTKEYWLKVAWFTKLGLQQPTDRDIKALIVCYFNDKNYPDLDNIARIFLNAWKKILYNDDAQVADLHIRRIVNKKERERTEVIISEV